MRIGLLGGTFDPIHLGHLRVAENARAALGLATVVFVPAHIPPHREPPLASAWDRFAMVALATQGTPAFLASSLELERGGMSYTVDTVDALRAERPGDEIVLLVGSDTYAEMEGWKEAARLFSLVAVAVVPRPGAPAPHTGVASGREVHRLPGSGLAVSSSAVRARAARRESVSSLVGEAVAEFLEKKGLYR